MEKKKTTMIQAVVATNSNPPGKSMHVERLLKTLFDFVHALQNEKVHESVAGAPLPRSG